MVSCGASEESGAEIQAVRCRKQRNEYPRAAKLRNGLKRFEPDPNAWCAEKHPCKFNYAGSDHEGPRFAVREVFISRSRWAARKRVHRMLKFAARPFRMRMHIPGQFADGHGLGPGVSGFPNLALFDGFQSFQSAAFSKNR